MFNVKILFTGFSGKMNDCALGWGTWALIYNDQFNILLDTGGAGLRGNFFKILKNNNLMPEDIDYVLLTHLHFDHACNVDLIPNAKFVLHEEEWLYANDLKNRDYFIEDKAVNYLKNKDVILLKGEENKVIDGITALHTPGHTPGSTTYILDMENNEKWALVGDAIKNRGELKNEEVQMTLDYEKTKNSIKKVKILADRILPGHDGWIKMEDGNIIPEGKNDKTIVFGEGVTINNGKTEIILSMD